MQEFHDTHYILLSGDEKSQKEEIQAEINLVLDFKLEELCNKKNLSLERKQSIREALLLKNSEQRTYLWLPLVFEVLERNFKNTESEWKTLINNPPANINLAYEKLLDRVNDDEQGLVRKLLQLVLAAFRPLTLREMNIALHVGDYIDRGLTSENDLDLSPDEDFKLWVLQTCGFFFTVYDDKVFFIHQTAKEFLLVPKTQRGPENNTAMSWCHTFTDREAHCSVVESCIAYLTLKQFSSGQFKIRADEAIPKLSEIDPLATESEDFTGCKTLNEYYNLFHCTSKVRTVSRCMTKGPSSKSQISDLMRLSIGYCTSACAKIYRKIHQRPRASVKSSFRTTSPCLGRIPKRCPLGSSSTSRCSLGRILNFKLPAFYRTLERDIMTRMLEILGITTAWLTLQLSSPIFD